MRMRFIMLLEVICNIACLVATIVLDSPYYMLHTALIIGCLIGAIPWVILSFMGGRSARSVRYSLLKLLLLVPIAINMWLCYIDIVYANYSFIVLSILFLLPDLDIIVNLHRIKRIV